MMHLCSLNLPLLAADVSAELVTTIFQTPSTDHLILTIHHSCESSGNHWTVSAFVKNTILLQQQCCLLLYPARISCLWTAVWTLFHPVSLNTLNTWKKWHFTEINMYIYFLHRPIVNIIQPAFLHSVEKVRDSFKKSLILRICCVKRKCNFMKCCPQQILSSLDFLVNSTNDVCEDVSFLVKKQCFCSNDIL